MAARAWPLLRGARLYAEDGTLFAADAWRLGLGSLFRSYAGYQHLVPRLLALAAVRLPLDALALCFTAVCTAIYAAIAARFASRDYQWLVKGAPSRTACCLGLCLLPGLGEVLGNAANLHWVFCLLLTLLALRDPKTGLSRGALGCSLLAAFTSGEAVVLLPVFCLRLARARVAGPALPWKGDAALVGALCAAAAVNFAARTSSPFIAVDAGTLLTVAREQLAALLLQPLLGDRTTGALAFRSAGVCWAFTLAGGGLLVWGSIRRSWSQPLLIAIAIAALSIVGLTLLVRQDSAVFFTDNFPTRIWWWNRYSFIVAPAGFLLWAGWFGYLSRRFHWSILAAWLLLFLALAAYRFQLRPPPGGPPWREALAAARSEAKQGCKAASRDPVPVPVSPAGWRLAVPREVLCPADSRAIRVK